MTKRECRVKVTLGPELGIGLGNTTDRAYTINVCMWDSAMCKDRKKNLLENSLRTQLGTVRVYYGGNVRK